MGSAAFASRLPAPAGAGARKARGCAACKLALRATQASRRARGSGLPPEAGVTGPSFTEFTCFYVRGFRCGGCLTCHGKVGRCSLCLDTAAVELWSILDRIDGQGRQSAPGRRARRLVGLEWFVLVRIHTYPDCSSGEKTRAWSQSLRVKTRQGFVYSKRVYHL